MDWYTDVAWNRLVKVQSSKDSGATTIQTASFYADGRRSFKVVDQSGLHDGTFRYYYDGQKIIEVRDGSGAMVQQFLHGTQYIDEVVMVRVKKKGDLYVHQDANWNVIGVSDLGGRVVERYAYSPYGQVTVFQETGFGDRDGDGDVDATDKGTVGTTCTGTVSGACRILDNTFDGTYGLVDALNFDALPLGLQIRPGLAATKVNQPFARQGIVWDAELQRLHVRTRHFNPAQARWLQRDSIGYTDSLNLYGAYSGNPISNLDPFGRDSCTDGCSGPAGSEEFCGCVLNCREASCMNDLVDCAADAGVDLGQDAVACALACTPAFVFGPIGFKICLAGCEGAADLIMLYEMGICMETFAFCGNSANEAYNNCCGE